MPTSTAECSPGADPVTAELYAPVTSDVILEVRTGKMKYMEGLKILSGIDKQICSGPVRVTSMGIQEDDHDPTFHGGQDKAVHAYCLTHYDAWKKEFPAVADRFRPGGFGENLVFARFNERNVHIGDVFSVGSDAEQGLLLQVSLPRQPCFKLNHRFGVRDFAPCTSRTSRTGWYYRVLREGTVEAGDEVRLIERPHPEWPLVRVQEYLHRQPDNLARTAELAGIAEFGAECRDQFRGRLAKLETQERRQQRRQRGEAEEKPWRVFRVAEKRRETARVTAFVLEAEAEDGWEEDELRPGSHVKLRLGNGLVRVYSVVSGSRQRFEIGVALAEDSRGGSKYLVEAVEVRSRVEVGGFSPGGGPLSNAASHHILVAGGIGITAFLAALAEMKAEHLSVEFHYAVRSRADVPFGARLAQLEAAPTPDADTVRVHYYCADEGRRLDVGAIVGRLPWNAHVSFCGPARMMEEAERVTKAAGLGAGDVHMEAFSAGDLTGDPFDVVVHDRRAEGGPLVALHVAGDETLLEVLQRRLGRDAVASSCEVGNCATCRIAVRQGRVKHCGTALTGVERAHAMLPCVSRGIGTLVVEI